MDLRNPSGTASASWYFVTAVRFSSRVAIKSRSNLPKRRSLRQQLPSKCVRRRTRHCDDGRLDFDAFGSSASIRRPARKTPGFSNSGFLHLFRPALQRRSRPSRSSLRKRRAELELLLKSTKPPIQSPLLPRSQNRNHWFSRFEGAGLDGVVAKPVDLPYQPDKRVMLKIKHERDCDCVVAGFRWYKQAEGKQVGSLLLGLYDESKALQHVGVCSSFSAEHVTNSSTFSRLIARTLCVVIPGRTGRSLMNFNAPPNIACPAARAAGATAKISPGNRCAPSSSSRSLTSTWKSRPISSHGTLSPLAQRSQASHLHLRATGTLSPARRTEIHLRPWSLVQRLLTLCPGHIHRRLHSELVTSFRPRARGLSLDAPNVSRSIPVRQVARLQLHRYIFFSPRLKL